MLQLDFAWKLLQARRKECFLQVPSKASRDKGTESLTCTCDLTS